ncbi:lipoprotein-anchoring transpeptidase ErfK/SrfK [Nakamurella flavida]|uniref:L,D-transpeptidase n=1 Tax=Nakamurella flavida TaxID=363630 RepID=UPI0027840EF7|nr:Ig-like domain-containing protein [Nakamurella flavida]MDP9779717.1 lipoprotein-anchoring transpeptidase ErfK/SrfK [Nakamurella flavida]
MAAAVLLAGCTSPGTLSGAGGAGSAGAGPASASAEAPTAGPSSAASAVTPAAPTTTAGSSTPAAPTSGSPTPPPPAPPAGVTVVPADAAQGVGPLDPITVTPVGGILQTVTLTNASGVDIQGALAADGSGWSVVPELGYGKTYTVTATAVNAQGAPTTTTTSFTTLTPDERTAASTYPSDGMQVGVGQPLVIVFDEPIVDRVAAQQAITVTTTPAQAGAFRWVSDTELRWRPAEFWQAGTTVQVDGLIYGRALGGGMYGQEDLHSSFTIGRSLISEVDDTTKQMTVTQDGQVVRTMPVSLGRDKYPTYNGVHVVAEKYEMKIMDSSTWGLTGTGAYRTEVQWATRISNSGEFVHAAPWSVEQQGFTNVSHGCVNLSTENARWFYDTVLPGDPVIIRNTVGPALESWDGYGDWQIPFEEYSAA